MSNQPDIPLFPVAGITIGPNPALGAIILRLDYLTGPMQDPNNANQGLHHALTLTQANYLAQQILSALDHLKNADFQTEPGPRH